MTSPVIVSRIQNRRGTQFQFDGLAYNPAGPNSMYPAGYDGLGGYGSLTNFTPSNYPNVLLPGEIGFVTDSGKVYIGNLNGTYTEIGTSGSATSGTELLPVTTTLPPTQASGATPVFVSLDELKYNVTAFFSIVYDITDSGSLDWNEVGSTFSRNGEIKITCLSGGPALLNDVSTEINTSSTFFSLQAVYNSPYIEIHYSHDHPTNLTFSTSTTRWLPF